MFLEANQIKKGHTDDKFEKDMKPLIKATLWKMCVLYWFFLMHKDSDWKPLGSHITVSSFNGIFKIAFREMWVRSGNRAIIA